MTTRTRSIHTPRTPHARRALLAFAFVQSALLVVGASTVAEARAPAAASASTEDHEGQRSELYREATKAAGAGRWAEAKERLRAALAIRSSPKILFSLAQAEEQLGQLASAQADYARALENGATEGKGDVVQAAEQAQRALGPRVPHVRVSVAGVATESIASMTLDDQPIALATAVAVDPGEHRLVARARGMRSATLTLKVEEGEQLDRVLSLVPEETSAPVPAPSVPPPAPPVRGTKAEPPPETGGAVMRTTGLVVVGVGAIALGVGAVFGVESMSKHQDAERACPDATCPTATGAGLWHDAVSSGNASNVAFVVGGIGLLAGAILWFAAPPSTGPSARVGLGPGSIALHGTW
jgi:hypothetical protein